MFKVLGRLSLSKGAVIILSDGQQFCKLLKLDFFFPRKKNLDYILPRDMEHLELVYQLLFLFLAKTWINLVKTGMMKAWNFSISSLYAGVLQMHTKGN